MIVKRKTSRRKLSSWKLRMEMTHSSKQSLVLGGLPNLVSFTKKKKKTLITI